MPNKQWWMGPIFISTCNHFVSPSPPPNPPQPCLQVKNWGNEWRNKQESISSHISAGWVSAVPEHSVGGRVSSFFFLWENTHPSCLLSTTLCIYSVINVMKWRLPRSSAVPHEQILPENRHSIRKDFGKRRMTNRRMFRTNNNVKMCFGFFYGNKLTTLCYPSVPYRCCGAFVCRYRP